MINNLKSNLTLPCSVVGPLCSEEQCNVILVMFLRALLVDPPKIQVCIKGVAIFSALQIQGQNSILSHLLGLCV